jgi:NAD-dependent dihydropyrimidine dehydrogenase PreA subunit
MSHFHYIKGERPQFLGHDHKSESVSFFRYLLHYIYGANEPALIRQASQICDGIEAAKTQEERQKKVNQFITLSSSKLTRSLPHALTVSHNAAKNVMDFAYNVEGPRGARIAVGPCVCQVAQKKYPNGVTEPEIKDITLFYGADIYNDLGAGYREITADEAKQILDDCHKKGYIHQALYCYNSGAGLFVMCNCDDQACGVIRGYNLTGSGVQKGPEVCSRDETKCLGVEKCGKCVERCRFHVNTIIDDKVVFDPSKCMGCEVCVATCKGNARSMIEREDYEYEQIMSKKLLLAGRYGYEELEEFA